MREKGRGKKRAGTGTWGMEKRKFGVRTRWRGEGL